jgi:hypothetical protein
MVAKAKQKNVIK